MGEKEGRFRPPEAAKRQIWGAPQAPQKHLLSCQGALVGRRRRPLSNLSNKTQVTDVYSYTPSTQFHSRGSLYKDQLYTQKLIQLQLKNISFLKTIIPIPKFLLFSSFLLSACFLLLYFDSFFDFIISSFWVGNTLF